MSHFSAASHGLEADEYLMEIGCAQILPLPPMEFVAKL
jgi:hypothetical protein